MERVRLCQFTDATLRTEVWFVLHRLGLHREIVLVHPANIGLPPQRAALGQTRDEVECWVPSFHVVLSCVNALSVRDAGWCSVSTSGRAHESLDSGAYPGSWTCHVEGRYRWAKVNLRNVARGTRFAGPCTSRAAVLVTVFSCVQLFPTTLRIMHIWCRALADAFISHRV